MSNRRYKIKMKRGTNERTEIIYASSETNARYEAERRNSGWTAVDVQEG